MSYRVHGELTAAGTQIVLIAAGTENNVANAAKRLQALTPLIKPTDPPGGLTMPLSWPAAVQLAHCFGPAWQPGPRLAGWIAQEFARRTTDLDAPLSVALPEGLTPRPYQVQGANLIASTGSVLITDEPGTGKTITTIVGLLERQHRTGTIAPVVVVCPASVVDPWVEAWQTWAPHVKVVTWRGAPRARKKLIGTAHVYVVSYDTARMDAGSTNKSTEPLLALNPVSIVIDECLPAGTPVDTPTGPRPIESLRIGDEVIGVDHTTGRAVVTTVQHTFERTTTQPLVNINGVSMTPNHPVWTAARGYVPADAVRRLDWVCEVRAHGHLQRDLRMVWPIIRQEGQAEPTAQVLRREVLREMAYVESGLRRVTQYPEASGGGECEHAALAREPGGPGDAASTPERPEQPLQQPDRASARGGHVAGAGLPNAHGWERAADRAASPAGRTVGLADRGRGADRSEAPMAVRVQDRHCLPGAADSDRGGRRESPESGSARARRAEGFATDGVRLDGAALLEQAGAGRDGRRSSGSADGRAVYNIETGTGNYVAGGLLVHNCHLAKNPHAGRSHAVRRLARNASTVVALSGTPITHHPADLWPTLVALSPNAWPSRERWVNRYCDTLPGDYSETILGLSTHREPEFRATLLGAHRRVAKADVLTQLPPKVYSVRTVQLPPAWRKAYDEIEHQMLAELPGGTELSVMSVLAQLTRLSQLASAAADVTVTTELKDGEEVEHVSVTLRAPSWKVDALLEVLDERPGKPVVAFAPSRQLMKLAGTTVEKTGRQVGYIVGGQSMRERTDTVEAFQRGKLDLLCATTGAGGVGITLTAASTVVFLQRPWSLVEALQAEDRCHRIGSEVHDSIEIIDVVAANTVDTRVRAVLRDKASQLADLVQDPRIVTELLGGSSTRKRSS